MSMIKPFAAYWFEWIVPTVRKPPPHPPGPSNWSRSSTSLPAFTLVEVVLALGIFTFAVVAIGGLFFVGIDANKGSSDEIQAANLASLLISTRRAVTTGTATAFANFALPPLSTAIAASGSGTYVMGVANDGTTTGTPAYNLYYRVTTNAATTGTNVAQVYLLLWWPTALITPSNNPGNRYELTTQVALQ